MIARKEIAPTRLQSDGFSERATANHTKQILVHLVAIMEERLVGVHVVEQREQVEVEDTKHLTLSLFNRRNKLFITLIMNFWLIITLLKINRSRSGLYSTE
jgi:hypothetical protein